MLDYKKDTQMGLRTDEAGNITGGNMARRKLSYF